MQGCADDEFCQRGVEQRDENLRLFSRVRLEECILLKKNKIEST